MDYENQENAVTEEEGRMPFLDHLEELRKRLIRGVTAVLIGFGICLYFSERLYHILAAPIMKVLLKAHRWSSSTRLKPFSCISR